MIFNGDDLLRVKIDDFLIQTHALVPSQITKTNRDFVVIGL